MGRSEVVKRCELCKAKARMHCASDQASLCWDCDAKVHSANFLVARHSRNLLCRVCQSPTPWSASGCKLGATVSVCEQCVDRSSCDDSDEEESVEEVEEEVVEENQVVPWSPPPPAESSSSVEEAVSGGDDVVSRKRCRIENYSPNHLSEEDQRCASAHLKICNPTLTPSDSAAGVSEVFSRVKSPPPQKIQRKDSGGMRIGDSGFASKEVSPGRNSGGEEMTGFCTSEPSI